MQAPAFDRFDRAWKNFARRHLHRDLRIAYLGDGTSTQTVVNATTAQIRACWYYEKHAGQKMPKSTAVLDENCGIYYENSADNDNLEVWIGKKPFSAKLYVLGPTEDALSGFSGQTPLERKITGAAGGAPTNATYITQTPNGFLSAEQALSALATGILKSTTGTGVVSIATGSDITTAFGSQSANTFYAAPSGGAGNPSFRAIASVDINPALLTPGPIGSTTPNTGKFSPSVTVEADAAAGVYFDDVYAGAGAGYPYFLGRRARGSKASPAVPQNGDPLFLLVGRGRQDASNWSSNDSVVVAGKAGETFSSTAQGAYLELVTTLVGTLTQVTALSLAHDGFANFLQYNGTTAAVDDVYWRHNSTGTPAANFGKGHQMLGQSSTTIDRKMARWRTYWEDATDAARRALAILSTWGIVSGSETEVDNLVLRVDGVHTPGVFAVKRSPTINQKIQDGYAMTVPGPYDIPAGVTVEIGAGSVLEIS